MEILFPPPSFSIQLASSSSFLSDRTSASPPPPPPPPEHRLDSPWNSFADDEIDYSSDSSSSIGVPDDSDDESVSSTGRDSEEVQSKLSIRSLEESLPIKRGLSSHFSGKSKSFANLAEAKSVKDIEKPENSLNKRRRILIASKLAKKSSFYAWPNPKSMPLLTLREEEDDDNNDDEDGEESGTAPSSSEDNEDEGRHEERKGKRVRDFHQRRLMSFNSRSFSMADLQQQHHGIDRQQEQ
ncbi:hypothetical protein IC575_007085 [Cucumis melo]|uniref:Protein ENL-like n=1 Tax=Cucumis melo TaxID=3656 RepID=A0A1S3BCK4_CUCME|nr:KID-containing protein 1-like [Cucumis melo]